MTPTRETLQELRIDRRDRNRSTSRRWPWIVVLALVGVLAAVLAFRLLGTRAVPVRTLAVAPAGGAAPEAVLNASGYVTARRRATVSSKFTGKVVEVSVEEGLAVKEGQALARLDDAMARTALALAESQRAAALRSVAEIEARQRLAEATLLRARRLVSEGVWGQADLDAAVADAEALRARLDLVRDEAEVAGRQVALRRIELEDTVIRAPFSGIAISKDAQPGEMISPVSAGGGFTRTGICTIVDMSSLEIEVDVNERSIHRVEPGQEVIATLDAYPDWRIPARVLTTIPSADRQKATVRVRIAFGSLDPRILPDMGIKVAFLGAVGDGAAARSPRHVVPRSAVRRQGDRDVVYVILGDRAERRAVQVGGVLPDDGIEVLAGLEDGDRIVVEGPADLADGDRVKAAP